MALFFSGVDLESIQSASVQDKQKPTVRQDFYALRSRNSRPGQPCNCKHRQIHSLPENHTSTRVTLILSRSDWPIRRFVALWR